MSFFFNISAVTLQKKNQKKKNERFCHYSNCCRLSWFLVCDRKTSEVPVFSTFPCDIKHKAVPIKKCFLFDAVAWQGDIVIFTGDFNATGPKTKARARIYFHRLLFHYHIFLTTSKISEKEPKTFLASDLLSSSSSSQPPTPGAVCLVVYSKQDLKHTTHRWHLNTSWWQR